MKMLNNAIATRGCIRGWRKILAILATVLCALVALRQPVLADKIVKSYVTDFNDGSGWKFDIYKDKDGKYWALWHSWDKDLKDVKTVVINPSNPNPDDSSSGPKDTDMARALAKQKGGSGIPEIDFFKTPAGKEITSGGNGPVPLTEPNYEKGPGAMGGGTVFDKTGQAKIAADKAINTNVLGGHGGHTGGIEFNSGSVTEQIKKHGSGGPPSDNDKGDGQGSHKPPPGSFLGPADLVDPNPPVPPIVKTGKLKTAVGLGSPEEKLKVVVPRKK